MRSANRSPGALALTLLLAALWLAGAPSAARAADAVALQVLVVHTSDAPGGVASDANARKADGILGRQIRYNSLKVVKAKQRKVALNDTWNELEQDWTLVTLPGTGHWSHIEKAEVVTETMRWWLSMRK